MRMASAALAGAFTLAAAGWALAGPEKVAFPKDYTSSDKFVRYEVLDIAERKQVRYYFVNREAVAEARSVADLPDGTILVREDHAALLDASSEPEKGVDGRFVAADEVLGVVVMRKGAGWGAAYPEDKRNGDWEYAVFLPDGSRKPDVPYARCFECHKPQAAQDFTFTLSADALAKLKAK